MPRDDKSGRETPPCPPRHPRRPGQLARGSASSPVQGGEDRSARASCGAHARPAWSYCSPETSSAGPGSSDPGEHSPLQSPEMLPPPPLRPVQLETAPGAPARTAAPRLRSRTAAPGPTHKGITNITMITRNGTAQVCLHLSFGGHLSFVQGVRKWLLR